MAATARPATPHHMATTTRSITMRRTIPPACMTAWISTSRVPISAVNQVASKGTYRALAVCRIGPVAVEQCLVVVCADLSVLGSRFADVTAHRIDD
jgi:hypothetical protein